MPPKNQEACFIDFLEAFCFQSGALSGKAQPILCFQSGSLSGKAQPILIRDFEAFAWSFFVCTISKAELCQNDKAISFG